MTGSAWTARLFRLAAAVAGVAAACAGAAEEAGGGPPDKQAKLRAELGKLPLRVVYESYGDGNWELRAMRADGTGGVNLTRTPDVHELLPHASPDGRRISFLVDAGTGRDKVRSAYVMNADGSERKRVAANARQPCWGPRGRRLLYARSEYKRFTHSSYATKELVFYDVAAGTHTPHANNKLLHVTYLCWSPGGRWIFGTVHGGMGFGHANVAIEADGTGVASVRRIGGCRIDVRRDGRKVLWNASDQAIVAADLDVNSRPPKVGTIRTIVSCPRTHMVYHGDWSPDGRYVLFAHGPTGQQHAGLKAPGWHICVADAAETNVWVRLTSDGQSNKEPDWLVPANPEGK